MYKNLLKLNFYESLILIFPIALILRSPVINFFLILTIFFTIYELFKKKSLYLLKEAWIYFFLLFIFYSFCRGFLATDSVLAIKSSIGLIRFLFFSLFIFICLQNAKNLNILIKFWTVILILLCADTLIQYFFGKDIFGFPELGIRLTGPFGRHQIIGAYLSYISIPIFFYFFSIIKDFNLSKKIFLFLFYFLLLVTIALTGERLAFIIFLSSSVIIFFIYFRIKIFFYLLFLMISFILFFYYFNFTFHTRANEFYSIISNFNTSGWGRLYQSSYLTFKSNIFFGVGLKNYAIVCDNQIIDPLQGVKDVSQFCNTHPHHFYLEILSESGVIGFLLLLLTFGTFFSSIINKIKKLKNNIIYKHYNGLLYGNILILFIYLWPIKTSGRFFTTWNGSFFWFNLGLALLITKGLYKKS
jgi:O-antigen ligase